MQIATFVRTIFLAGLIQLSVAAAAERGLATIPIGDLVLWFDAGTWRVEGDGNAYAARSVDAGPRDLPIVIEIAGDGRLCSPEAMLEKARIFHPDAWEYGTTTIARTGFDLHVATLEMGCRNLTGSPVFACTAFAGRHYFLTAAPGGCRGTPPNYDGPVLELLKGLSVP